MISMCLLRCLHPPAGALALLVVLADPDSASLGWGMLAPVMLGAVCMLIAALAYNNLTRVRYPKKPSEPSPAASTDQAPVNPGISAEDLHHALQQMDAFIDVTPEDLEELIRASELHARRRSIGEVFSQNR